MAQLSTASRLASEIEATADALLGYFVERCRSDGLSWSQISTALGVTKQAVHKRFSVVPSEPASREGDAGGERGDGGEYAEFAQASLVAIEEVKRLGFMPGGWIGLIDQLGAIGAARHLLDGGKVLPVFHYLVSLHRTDLSIEGMALRPQSRALFSEAQIDEARRRFDLVGLKTDDPSADLVPTERTGIKKSGKIERLEAS